MVNPFKKAQINMGLPVRDQPLGYNHEDAGPGAFGTFTPGDIVEVVGSQEAKPQNWSAIKNDWSYEKADQLLGKRDSKKLANNTYLNRIQGGDIGVLLHNTFIVVYHADGTFELDTGGRWNTVTTRARLNEYSPIQVHAGSADRSGHASELLMSTPWGAIEVDGVLMSNSTGMPVDWQEQELPPHAADYIGHTGQILYRDDRRSRGEESWRKKNVWKVMFEDGEVGFYDEKDLKLVTPAVSAERIQQKSPAPEIQGEEDIILAVRNPWLKGQELKNDVLSHETESPSDPESMTGHNLEVVDRTDDKKNRRPTHHQGPVKSAQNERAFKAGDVVQFDSPDLSEEGYGYITYAGDSASDGEPMYTVQSTDGTNHFVRESHMRLHGSVIEKPAPTTDELDQWYKQSGRNPFHMAQKETGHFDEGMTDNDTAETGHIGSSEAKQGPNRGGRTPGSLDNPTPNNPFAHETSENSKGTQVS